MKKIITILSILTLTISLVGCNPFAKSDDKSSGTNVESSSQSNDENNAVEYSSEWEDVDTESEDEDEDTSSKKPANNKDTSSNNKDTSSDDKEDSSNNGNSSNSGKIEDKDGDGWSDEWK